MTDAKITVEVDGVRRGLLVEDVDLDSNRNDLALEVGLRIVDAIWFEMEGG